MQILDCFAVIADYNPFHNGHKFHIEKSRESQASHIAVIMSGNFVQRGEPAMFDKRVRALCALYGGADLVLELPLPWAMATAERFAHGGVYIASGLGCVSHLSFGSECGDAELLLSAARVLREPAVDESIRALLDLGMSFASAREAAFVEHCSLPRSLISEPNNILGLEYVSAIIKQGSSLLPFTIKRTTAHHGTLNEDSFTNAGNLRRMIRGSDGDAKALLTQLDGLVPHECIKPLVSASSQGRIVLFDKEAGQRALTVLRTLKAKDFALCADVSEGLENRLYASARQATSLDELYSAAKTRRYSHARIRRAAMSSFLGLDASLAREAPPYIRVLGFNDRGREILREAKSSSSLPIVMRAADVEELSPFAKRVFDAECRATDLFWMLSKKIRPCGTDMTDGLVMV